MSTVRAVVGQRAGRYFDPGVPAPTRHGSGATRNACAVLRTAHDERSGALASGALRLDGKIIVTPIRDDQSGVILPYIDIVSISTSAEGAMKYADASVQALGAFLLAQQRASNVAEADRVIIQPIIRPNGAVVYRPRPKTMPIVVFFAVMFATVGLAFVLENARPRSRRLDPENRSEIPKAEPQRRTA